VPHDSHPFPDDSDQIPAEIRQITERMHWQNARSVDAVAPHAYNVCGWDRDDATEAQ
jgi:hypothetical protein